MDGSRGNSAGLENLGPPRGCWLLRLSLWLNQYWLVDDELADVLSCNQLSMAIIDHFIYDLVDEDEVFANALFIQDTAVITEDLHHSINDVHDGAGSGIGLTCSHKVDAELLGEEVVHSIDVL